MATRDELILALAGRYRGSTRSDRGRILDEFTAISGLHRKHAMRLLREGRAGQRTGPRPARRLYDDAVREALIVAWEASDRLCGKRLRALLPVLVEAMVRHGHLDLAPDIRAGLLAMSAATIDRALRPMREAGAGRRRRSNSSAAIRRAVPIRTFDGWDNPPPGFVEADLVFHSGPVTKGSFLYTLTLTDIATGWTECVPLLVREQKLLTEALRIVRAQLPFKLQGFDTDNDTVFLNETVKAYCDDTGLIFTRCRPYRKNDQAWVEQKNGAVVRHVVGYRRYEGPQAAAVMMKLYASLRLFVNFFQPSFKLVEKVRNGAKVKKTYLPPATPCQRLLSNPHIGKDICCALEATFVDLDPIKLLQDIRKAQEELVAIADRASADAAFTADAPSLEMFLDGLKTAWRAGENRPTRQAKPSAPRGRRRPDPFAAVTTTLREWFEAEPRRTSGEFLERLQLEYPGKFADKLTRTLQRRIKVWRFERAKMLVFGATAATDSGKADLPTTATAAARAPDRGATIGDCPASADSFAILGALPPNPRDI